MKENTCIRVSADQNQIKTGKEKLEAAEKSFQRLARVLSLAGSEVRLKVLYLIEEETELCVCDLSDMLQMSIPAISQHLRKLKDAGILKSRKTGQTVFYSLKEEHLEIIKPLFQHITQNSVKNQTT
ncbi:DNA-binding transcriptional ArsR family regulator [Pedobacter sp. CG_S7]|uniref:ArsR/SmtB family transcription factor n=1 Tax=Pedobacter sp. CG_S7 TaxID=3143930 RepID=UPI0033973AA6